MHVGNSTWFKGAMCAAVTFTTIGVKGLKLFTRGLGAKIKRKQLTVVLVERSERFFSNGPGHGGQSWRLVRDRWARVQAFLNPYCIGTSFSVAYTGWLNRFTGICSCLALCRSLSGVARRASLLMFPPVSLHIRLHAFHFHLRTCRRWFWSA